MPFSLLLALRFLRSSSYEKNIATMVKICFISISIGTFALTLVAAIMTGFEKATHAKLQGVHADITINAQGNALDYPKLSTVLSTEYADSIASFSPTAISQVIIQNKNNDAMPMQISLLKAVDPEKEPYVSTLGSLIKSSDPNPWSSLTANTIFIGQAQADRLKLKEGDAASLLYTQEEILSNKIILDEKIVTVKGIFKTGFHDFDEHVIIASFDLFKELYSSAITEVTVKLKNPSNAPAVIESLKKRISLDVHSWKDLYPPVIAALTLEKYAMLFIFALVALVASLTIISLLFMYATQKKLDIAILKTMGMSDAAITTTFIAISLFLTLSATICGIILALLATWFLNYYPFIQLPDSYYVSHLPATMNVGIIFSVLLLSFFIGLLAALLPAQKIRSMNVARVLKGLP